METRDRLVVSLGGASWIHEISREAEIVGRAAGSDLRLDDGRCSRRHLRLVRSVEGLGFEDLGTLNGTLLNGLPSRGGMLKDGDVLEIGSARLAYRRVAEGDRGAARGTDLLLTAEGRTQLYEMGKDEILIGRDPGCDLRLEDPACSRRQARLLKTPEGLRIENLGSVNPTLLNGVPVPRTAPAASGDTISFGRSELRILLPEEASPTPGALEAPDSRRRRILLTRKAEERRSVLLPLGAATAAAILLWVAIQNRGHEPPPSSPAPPDVPSAPSADPRLGAAEALRAALRERDGRPEDHDASIRRFHDVARLFPGTPEAAEAMAAARAEHSRWEASQDARLEGTLQASAELSRSGMPRLARNVLTAFLEGGTGNPERSRKVQDRLRALDEDLDREARKAAGEALDLARAGRFEEARGRMREERERLAGLPWGSAAEVLLRQIDVLQAEAEEKRLERERCAREAAEQARSAEERQRLSEAWKAGQRSFAARLRTLSPKDRPAREEAFEALIRFDPALEPFVLDALRQAHGQRLRDMDSRLRTQEVQDLKGRMKGDLEGRRKAALALILDPERYPYFHGKPNPYGPDGARVQTEVDLLVRDVEEAYRPARALLQAVRGLKGFDALLADLEELERDLERCGGPLERKDTFAGLMDLRLKVDFSREEEMDKASARILAENERTAAARIREGKLDPSEVQCILVTNRYRILMGLLPARIEPTLCAASRLHSKDMETRGYFAHVDPDGKGPGDRARGAGFPGTGSSENLVMGRASPEEAFEAWKHSSGHHRNMLTPQWTMIGVGRSGNHWTMMLGF